MLLVEASRTLALLTLALALAVLLNLQPLNLINVTRLNAGARQENLLMGSSSRCPLKMDGPTERGINGTFALE